MHLKGRKKRTDRFVSKRVTLRRKRIMSKKRLKVIRAKRKRSKIMRD
jgi:hypothetical protein